MDTSDMLHALHQRRLRRMVATCLKAYEINARAGLVEKAERALQNAAYYERQLGDISTAEFLARR